MHLSFSKTVELRQPFRLLHLPPEAVIYRNGYRHPLTRFQKFVSGPVFKRLYKQSRRLRKNACGKFEFTNRNTRSIISFRAQNTQFHSIYLPEYRYYEPETLALVDLLLPRCQVFYDIGSNWGHFSLYAASNPLFSGSVYAFEPMPSTFDDLENTVRQAQLSQQIHCSPWALSDSDQTAYLHLPDGIHSGNATVTNLTGGIKITQCKLDDLTLPIPDLIKVDAEGHESAIFSGGRKRISEHQPFIIFEHFRNSSNPLIAAAPLLKLQQAGYVFFLPLFIHTRDGHIVHENKQDQIPSTAPEATLGLFQFTLEERNFLEIQANILACPTIKLEELKACFQ
jgi:FkbM family methyltransferase